MEGIVEAIFLKRPNRFVAECLVGDRIVQAHLPNPGRMWELLFPGRTMFLLPKVSEGMRTQFRVVGIERDGVPIMLDTHYNNDVAAELITTKNIKGWEDWEVLRREVTFGASRFDLLLGRGEERKIVEVKSCTLFGKETAMFPDAITERGRKHLLELAELSSCGWQAGVLFLVHWPQARWFLPDYHTDLAFSRTLSELRNVLDIKAAALEWYRDLTLGDEVRDLPIPWSVVDREAHDGGVYMVVLYMEENKTLLIGSKGLFHFPKGYYVYVGSANHNLGKRLDRHQRKRKNFHWHIDYLRDSASFIAALPIRTTAMVEHELATAVSAVADWTIPGFGASDCGCETHLFGMHSDPVHTPAFMDVVQEFRMDRLQELIHLTPSG